MTEEILDDLYECIIDGDKQEAPIQVQKALDGKMAPDVILNDGMISAMKEVGSLFEAGEFFVPEMLIAARAMQAGLNVLRPILVGSGTVQSAGTVVIGTVKGDIHDIGKNLVVMMMEGAGFEVIDLGINQSAEDFVTAVEQHKPNVLGMSAMLTTTMPYMRVVIETLKEKGLRDDLVIMIGGAPIDASFAEHVEADAYCKSAGLASEMAKKLMQIKAGTA